MPRTREQLLELLTSVADCLGRSYQGSWSFRPNPPDYPAGGHLDESESGLSFYARHDGSRDKDVIEIKAQSPKDARGQEPYVTSRARVAINVSAGKSPLQIAGDITRRLLPEWLPLYEQALESIASSNEYHQTVESVAAEIAKITGGRLSGHDVSFHAYPVHTLHHFNRNSPMKMKPEDFKVVRDAITPLLIDPVNENLWRNYKAKGLTKKRFVWDTLWASKLNITPLYTYLDDNNITTALLKICDPYMVD